MTGKRFQVCSQKEALAATIDYADGSTSFCILPIIGEIDGECFVEDGGEVLPVSEIDTPYDDCAIYILGLGEIVTLEVKAELERQLRARMSILV